MGRRRDLVQADDRAARVDQQPVVVEVSVARKARLDHVAVFRQQRPKLGRERLLHERTTFAGHDGALALIVA